MKLDDLEIYQLSMEIGERIWQIVDRWSYFPKDTIGKQLVRSVDSIAANISEGYGRYHFKEAKNFNYYARGSLYETSTWIKKAYLRHLIEKNEFDDLSKNIQKLGIKLNNYIKSISKFRLSFCINLV